MPEVSLEIVSIKRITSDPLRSQWLYLRHFSLIAERKKNIRLVRCGTLGYSWACQL